MENAYFVRRRIVGTAQLKENQQVMDSVKYARNSGYSVSHVARLCREKKLRAYKIAGKWQIVFTND